MFQNYVAIWEFVWQLAKEYLNVLNIILEIYHKYSSYISSEALFGLLQMLKK